jgi:DNA-directed RNA polymerase subunit beta'
MIEKEKLFQNRIIDKKQLKQIMSWAFTNYGIVKASFLADQLKDLGFKYATKAGISLSIEDLRVPPIKKNLIQIALKKVYQTEVEASRGEITEVERFQKIIQTWNLTSETLKDRVVRYFKETDPLNSVYMMAFSGARGNLSQVRQLVGMRGLMADPNGQIIDLPIITNFREGLTITDYIISSYGARKGLVDTALRTADSGYLTRRLIDVAQDIITREKDCKSEFGISLTDVVESNDLIVSLEDRILGRTLLRPILNSHTAEQLFIANQEINLIVAKQIAQLKLKKVFVRSPLTCHSRRSVCQQCYGWNLAYGRLVDLGEAVGIIAAQSIGEPGTQLTMRTFHTGGVFTTETTMQIPAEFSGKIVFSPLLKIRATRTKYGEPALISENAGLLKLIGYQNQIKEIELLPETLIFVKKNGFIKKDGIIAELPSLTRKTGEEKAIKYVPAKQSGEVIFENSEFQNSSLVLENSDRTNFLVWVLSGQVYNIPFRSNIKIRSLLEVRDMQSFAETYLICMNSGKVELSRNYLKEKIDQVNITQSFTNFKNFRLFLEKENAIIRKCYVYHSGGTQFSINLPSIKSILKNSYPILGYLENKVYQIETGGIIYITNYRKIHSPFLNEEMDLKNGQTIFYIPESNYKIDRDSTELKVKKGQYISEGFEIFKNQFTKTAGLIDFTRSKPFIQEIVVKPGQAIFLTEEKDWQKYHKTVYFPGEFLLETFEVNHLSYTEVKKITKDIIQIWIRPIIRYELVKNQKMLQTKQLTNTEIKFGPFQNYFKNGTLLKTNKSSLLTKQAIIFNPKATLKNLLTKIEIQQTLKSWIYLAVDISEIISIDHFIPNEIQKQNFFTGSLVENHQYIEPYSIITDFEILIPKKSFIYSIKQQIVGKKKKIALFTNHDYKSIYLEDSHINVSKNQLIRKGEKIGTSLIVQDSGLVFDIVGNYLLLQKGQPYLFSQKEFVEKNWGSLVQKEDNLGLLIYERARTGDIVQGLPRVEEILEARKPKFNSKSVIRPGIVKNIVYNSNEILIWILPSTVYTISSTDRLLVGKLEFVNVGQALNDAAINPHTILEIYFQYYFSLNIFNIYESAYRSLRKVQALLLRSVQSVYYAQGVTIADKHVEIIIKQMTVKVQITFPGDTNLLPGEILDLQQIDYINKSLISLNKALFQPILLGITKASLKTDSFISAASFQHTTQVLTEAAIQGKIDWLRGLKENVIVGRLIPAGTGFNAYTDISYISVKVPSSEEREASKETVDFTQTYNRYEKLKKRITLKPLESI